MAICEATLVLQLRSISRAAAGAAGAVLAIGVLVGAIAHQAPGQRDLVWAIDLIGNGVALDHSYVIIDAASFSGTPAGVMSEVEAILASVRVGHWG